MNKLTLTLATTALLFSTNVLSQKYTFVGTDNSISTQLCVHAGMNDKSAFKKTLRNIHSINKYRVINNFTCNDQSLAKFAYRYGADDTFNYINRYSYTKNKVVPSVTIRDVAKSDKPITIYVSTGN